MEIEILNEANLRAWGKRLNLPEGGIDALTAMSRAVQRDPRLFEIFSAFYEKTSLRGEWHREWSPLPMDPYVTERYGVQASLFYLLGYFAALPHAERTYQRMGISQQIFADTMWDLNFYTCKPFNIYGQWKFNEFGWTWRHLACELFRLGRMQYQLAPFEGEVAAFRHRQSGAVRLLCGPRLALRPDGSAQGAGMRGDEKANINLAELEGTWFPTFEETPSGWRGYPIDPVGRALPEPVLLPRAEWACILNKGDLVLDLHIPRAANLTIEDCRESIRQAYEFFPHYFPERPFKAIVCHTWLFTPQLQQFLKPDSNIVRFQREFYLYPHPGGPEFLWTFVFGDQYKDLASAPRDTALRRITLEWLEAGKPIFDLPGVMFHGPDEWGTQPYWAA